MRRVLCFVLLLALGHAAVLPRKTRQVEYSGNGGYGGPGGVGGYGGSEPLGTFGGLRPGQGVVYQGYGNNYGIPGLKAGDEVVYEGVVGNGFQGYQGFGNGYQGYGLNGGYQGLQGFGGNQFQGGYYPEF